MKYNTLSTSSVAAEGKKATFTIYADLDIGTDKVSYTEEEMVLVRQELEKVQNDLSIQRKRCRQLVSQYTQKLREKEQLYQTEKDLRDTQLARIIKTLLIFEARLKQEQKFISRQLDEKDYIIRKQRNDIKNLLANSYCKNCHQYFTPSPQLESFDSSSEYVPTEHEYHSSNFESLDSSTETYGTMSERSANLSKESLENATSNSEDSTANSSEKRGNLDSNYELLKVRNHSPISNGDNTSADYDNFDSLPTESTSDKLSLVSENIDFRLSKNSHSENSDESTYDSECEKTVIDKLNEENLVKNDKTNSKNQPSVTKKKCEESQENKLSYTIPVFESNNEGNENWYASASDQEDEDRTELYRNNPVLECVNQILLQNINDPMNSPPNERKNGKSEKRVKFSDKEEQILTEENVKTNYQSHDYYETPIQKTPNFYETPQSIYSNDYEQILSKCSQQTFSDSPSYVEMETTKSPITATPNEVKDPNVVRKSKILRNPPALPPKPPNLVSKYKIKNPQTKSKKCQIELHKSSENEPDYCSISELNLPPQKKNVSFNKISVVADINFPTQIGVLTKINAPSPALLKVKPDLLDIDPPPSLVVKKCIEKMNIQMAKKSELNLSVLKSSQKNEGVVLKPSPKKIELSDIPKLPQVSEIIIPSDSDDQSCSEERVSSDNYVKNNSEILKIKNEMRKSLPIGSSISSIINEFNNHQILADISKKPAQKVDKRKFASFENLQNLDKHFTVPQKEPETPKFDAFDLSQNFEEFKLDDCEIEEFKMDDLPDEDFGVHSLQNVEDTTNDTEMELRSTQVELVRATFDPTIPTLNVNSVEELRKQLELQKSKNSPVIQVSRDRAKSLSPEPNYEHFLECTGLSSKSILTPSRLLSNHKNVLKPKDVKLRSRVMKANNIFERYNGTTVKYWSEPFV